MLFHDHVHVNERRMAIILLEVCVDGFQGFGNFKKIKQHEIIREKKTRKNKDLVFSGFQYLYKQLNKMPYGEDPTLVF